METYGISSVIGFELPLVQFNQNVFNYDPPSYKFNQYE